MQTRNYGAMFPNFDSEFEAFPSSDAEGFDQAEFADNEADGAQMQLAAELLGVSSEPELEAFLGGLISKAAGLASNFIKSPAGQQLGGLLKSAAKKALPQLGGAVGQQLGGDSGAQFGSQIAEKAGALLGLELEGLTPEDSEFEVARQVVRLGQDAARRAAAGPRTPTAARQAFAAAAREHAPGLVPRMQGGSGVGHFPVAGRWVRHGRTITLR